MSTRLSKRVAQSTTLSSRRGGEPLEPSPENKHQVDSREGTVQIPEPYTLRQLQEQPTRDQEDSLEPVDESVLYVYEPQGELIQEQLDRTTSRNEFTVAPTIAGSGASQSLLIDVTDSTHPLPKHTTVPAVASSTKRKSLFNSEDRRNDKRPSQHRASHTMTETVDDADMPVDKAPPPQNTRSRSGPSASSGRGQGRTGAETSAARPQPSRPSTDPSNPTILPARKVFPIQIGDKLFRLSGASISSDAPSYFSQFFVEQLRENEGADSVRTLYVDRDPATFEDISLHLQGYFVEPKDGPHFVRLFADAQFFSLPRLTAQLFASPIYVRIGDEEFQIPRDLFSNPGDSPNYFSLGFAVFFSTPQDVFPGLSQRTLLRPPSIMPPRVPNRSAKTFADLLHILKGYPVEIRSDEHREELLRDARYFHFLGLEQRLIRHQISYNITRKKSEILLRLEDVKPAGVSFAADSVASSSEEDSPASGDVQSTSSRAGWVCYQRPHADADAHNLIIETDGDGDILLSVAPSSSSASFRIGRAIFHRQMLSRITSLLSVIANKMDLPLTQTLGLMTVTRGAGAASQPASPIFTGLSEESVKVRIGSHADVTVDGIKWLLGEDEDDDDEEVGGMRADSSQRPRPSKRRRRDDDDEEEGEDWIVRKAQWCLRVQPSSGRGQGVGRTGVEVILAAVKIEAFSGERGCNAARGWLS